MVKSIHLVVIGFHNELWERNDMPLSLLTLANLEDVRRKAEVGFEVGGGGLV